MRSYSRWLEPRSQYFWSKWAWIHFQGLHGPLPWAGPVWDHFKLHESHFPNTFLPLSLLMFSLLYTFPTSTFPDLSIRMNCLLLNSIFYISVLHFGCLWASINLWQANSPCSCCYALQYIFKSLPHIRHPEHLWQMKEWKFSELWFLTFKKQSLT